AGGAAGDLRRELAVEGASVTVVVRRRQDREEDAASQRPSASLIKNTLLEAFGGQLLVTPIAGYLGYYGFMKAGGSALDAKLPSLLGMYKAFAFAQFVNEHGFYWAHRLYHHKALHATFHKQHHSFIESMGISAEYAGPVEQVFANFMPSLGGMAAYGTHPYLFFFWLIYRLEETYEAHSGYTFLGKLGLFNGENSAFHHAHHLENRGNIGAWHIDALFGTIDAWLADGDTEGYVSKHLHGHPKNKNKDAICQACDGDAGAEAVTPKQIGNRVSAAAGRPVPARFVQAARVGAGVRGRASNNKRHRDWGPMSAPEAKKKKAATGGAAFSPRLDPRPQYPSWGAILRKYATVYTRLPILLALSAK
ncbi:Putative methylsterol monooxygenase DDB_G0270946 (C-4 methylsterol oxidase), partial [Durusdinium trenchii]